MDRPEVGALDTAAVLDTFPNSIADLVRTYPPELRHTVLTCGLALGGAAMPHYLVRYGDNDIGPHAYVFAYGDRGQGKGFVAKLGRVLDGVEERRREQNAELAAAYQKDVLDHEQAVKDYRDPKKPDALDLPPKPAPPAERMLFVAANSSQASIYKRLADNPDTAVIVESEAATLVNALSKDFGSFRADLCKAFHSEPMSTGRTTVENHTIATPHLAIVLAGTGSALKNLLGSPEDGLLSRFTYVEVPFDNAFQNPMDAKFNTARDGASEALKRRLLGVYDALIARSPTAPVGGATEAALRFKLSERQQELFVARYGKIKDRITGDGERERSGELHRVALMVVRAAMTVTALRAPVSDLKGRDVLTCSDADFDAAMSLGRAWWEQTVAVLDRTERSGPELRPQQAELLAGLKVTFETNEAVAEGKVLGASERTVKRWLKGWKVDPRGPVYSSQQGLYHKREGADDHDAG